MKIHIEEHYGEFWAYDDDTYDGAPDAHCPVGVGVTDYAAINDLMEQVIDEIEERLENARFERDCLKAENEAYRIRYPKVAPETSLYKAASDLADALAIPAYPAKTEARGEAPDVVYTQEKEECDCDGGGSGCQGRLPDEPPEWDSGYDEFNNKE